MRPSRGFLGTKLLGTAWAVLAGLLAANAAHAGQPRLVMDLEPAYPQEVSPFNEATAWSSVGDKALFALPQGSDPTGAGLLASDGTAAHTGVVGSVVPATDYFQLPPPQLIGDRLVFFAYDGLWRTDGTTYGTYQLAAADGSAGVARLGQRLLFSSCSPCGVWVTDGTTAGTVPLADVVPEVAGVAPGFIRAAGGRAFFASPVGFATKVWVTDTTAGGTRQVWEGSQVLAMATAGERTVFFAFGAAANTIDVWSVAHDEAAVRLATLIGSRELTAHGGYAYWTAFDPQHGAELWRSDGTVAGTRVITNLPDPQPFGCSDCVPPLATVGGKLFFVATDESGTRRLWVTDGDPAAARSLSVGCADGECPVLDTPRLWTLGNRVLFADSGFGSSPAIWASDGTATGTRRLVPGTNHRDQRYLQLADGHAFFAIEGVGAFSEEVWISDGTPAGSHLVVSLPNVRFSGAGLSVVAVQSRFFFVAGGTDGSRIYSSDGSPGGTQVVSFTDRGGVSSRPSTVVATGSDAAFVTCQRGQRQLWRSAGTAETTSSVGDPFGSASCDHEFGYSPEVTVIGGRAIVRMSDLSGAGDRLYGVPLGGGPVESLSSGSVSSVAVAGTRALFVVDYFFTFELWSSDGTANGTRTVMQLPVDYVEGEMSSFGSRVYFTAVPPDGGSGHELWASDGTAGGTAVVANVPGPMETVLAAGGVGYFFVNAFSQGPELWRTDGTTGGTTRVKAFPLTGVLPTFDMALLDDRVYFSLPGATNRAELWRSDGTPAGTQRLAELPPTSSSAGNATQLTTAEGRVFFSYCDFVHGCELWSSDGTAAGTGLVADIRGGSASSAPTELTAFGDGVFFAAEHEGLGIELWRSDGTAEGTRLFADLSPGPRSSGPRRLRQVGAQLFLAADDGIHGEELWSVPESGLAGCAPSSRAVCLGDGRFEVTAFWRDPRGATGDGRAVGLTEDTGYFWFFSPANVEAVVKVLDGQALNAHRWVFYGALSDVEYALTVRDTDTGVSRRYYNPPGVMASVGDTEAFGRRGTPEVLPPVRQTSGAVIEAAAVLGTKTTCAPDAGTLCLEGGRFAVTSSWRDFQGGAGNGHAVGLTGDTGYFWFFSPTNVEVVLKVLDGRLVNDKFWVFYGALSNVEYTLRVTDTVAGTTREYRNPSGRFASVADVSAF